MEILTVNNWNLFYKKNHSDVVDIRFSVIAGSEKEDRERIYGVAHFVEHLIFKGTEKRSYLDISDEIAAIGGQSNAFTSRSIVSYYIRIIKMNWVKAFEILTDMIFNSLFDEGEIEKERNVILEEARNNLDDHESYIMEEALIDALSPRRGHRIIGTMESIQSISRDDITGFMSRHYRGDNVLVSIAGNIDREEVVEQAARYLPKGEKYPKEICTEADPVFNTRPLDLSREKLQQSYSLQFFNGLGRDHPLYDTQRVLLNALGGGMHSILFKKIREEHGLCYAIDAGEVCNCKDTSTVCIHTNLTKTNLNKTKIMIYEIIHSIKANGIDSRLLEISKVDYTSFIAMHTETSTGYVLFYAMNYLLDLYRDFDRIYSDIHGVSNDQIIEAANLIFGDCKEAVLS